MRTPLLVAAFILSVLVAASGGAVAGGLVTSAQIKNGTITGKDVKKHSLSTRNLTKKAVAQLAGAPGPAGAPGAAGPPGLGGTQLSYRHVLNYPAETTSGADVLTVGGVIYAGRCYYDQDDVWVELSIRSAASITVAGQVTNGSTVQPVLETGAGIRLVVAEAGSLLGGGGTSQRGGTVSVLQAAGLQQVSFHATASGNRTCAVNGTVVTSR